MNKLFILFTLFAVTAFGQNKKLSSFLGSDFQTISARKNIPYMETNPLCEMVPSLSIKNDTSGMVYQNEYVLFRNLECLSADSMKSAVNFLKTTFVSNKEYQEFQKWVRDSASRERIYAGTSAGNEAVKWLNVPTKDFKSLHLSAREENRKKYPLNWKKEFSYDDLNLMPLLVDMYLPVNERFYKSRDFDERKNTYHYTLFPSNQTAEKFGGIRFEITTVSHEAFWAKESASINDEVSVLGQIYDRLFLSNPVVGLTGMQANAFCHWKEIQLQNELDKRQLPYKVRLTLPMVSEYVNTSKTLTIPEKNYTLNWKITVKDYQSFIKAVRDSLFKEVLFMELEEDWLASRFLQAKKVYLDESTLGIVEYDPSDRVENRSIFPLTEDQKILQKYTEQIKAIESRYAEKLNNYLYYRMNVKGKTILGKMETDSGSGYANNFGDKGHLVELLSVSETDSLGHPIGMDLSMNWVNCLYQGTGVRDHENYARFILREVVQVTPSIPIENQQPEVLMKGITYEQALAYYHWKYPIWKAKVGEDWQNYVYPNEKQFEQIQNGESLIIPEHQLNFPSPLFRYVVSFIPEKK